MNFLVCLIIAIALVTFAATAFIWSFHLSLLSMQTPSYLTDGFCSIGSPEITKFVLKGSAEILSFIICRVPMSIDVVLATFKDDLLPCRQTLRFSNSVFMVLVVFDIHHRMCQTSVIRIHCSLRAFQCAWQIINIKDEQ